MGGEDSFSAYQDGEHIAATLQIMNKGRLNDRWTAGREFVSRMSRLSYVNARCLMVSGAHVSVWVTIERTLSRAFTRREHVEWADLPFDTLLLISQQAMFTEDPGWLPHPPDVVPTPRRHLPSLTGREHRYNALYGAKLLLVMNSESVPTEVSNNAYAAFSALVSYMTDDEKHALTMGGIDVGIDVCGWVAMASVVRTAFRLERSEPGWGPSVELIDTLSLNELVAVLIGRVTLGLWERWERDRGHSRYPFTWVSRRDRELIEWRGERYERRRLELELQTTAQRPPPPRNEPWWVASVPSIGTIRAKAAEILDDALLTGRVTVFPNSTVEIRIDGVSTMACTEVSDCLMEHKNIPWFAEMRKALEEARDEEFHDVVANAGYGSVKNGAFYDLLEPRPWTAMYTGSSRGCGVPLVEHQAGDTPFVAHTCLESIDAIATRAGGSVDDYLPCMNTGGVCGTRGGLRATAVSTTAPKVTIGVGIHVPAVMWLSKPMFLLKDGKTPVTEMIWLRHATGPMAGTLTGEWRDLKTWKAEQGNERKGCEHYVRDTAATNYITKRKRLLAEVMRPIVTIQAGARGMPYRYGRQARKEFIALFKQSQKKDGFKAESFTALCTGLQDTSKKKGGLAFWGKLRGKEIGAGRWKTMRDITGLSDVKIQTSLDKGVEEFATDMLQARADMLQARAEKMALRFSP